MPNRCLLATLTTAALLAACQTAQEGPALPVAAAGIAEADPVWRARADGARVHVLSGVACPQALGGLAFLRAVAFDPEGRDVSCGWFDPERPHVLTRYVTAMPGRSAANHAAEAAAAVTSVHALRPLASASTACAEALTAAFPDAGAEDLGCHVFDSVTEPTLVAVLDVEGWHVKVRLTRDGAADTPAMIAETGKALAAARADILATPGRAPMPPVAGRIET